MQKVFDLSVSNSPDDYDFKIDLGSVILSVRLPLYDDTKRTTRLLSIKIKQSIDKLKKRGLWQELEDETTAINDAVNQLISEAY